MGITSEPTACPFCKFLAGEETAYNRSTDIVLRNGETMAFEYGCDGTSTRQHNGAAAGQEVWHFHVHVFPRYPGDRLYQDDDRILWPDAEERAPYAERLRRALG